MKISYRDQEDKAPAFLYDHPECRILMVLHEDGEIFVYYVHKFTTYINKVKNKALRPVMFQLSNLIPLENEEFDYVHSYIQQVANYDGRWEGEEVDGIDEPY